MNISVLREMSPEERQVKLEELYEALFKLRFHKTTGQLDNPSEIRTIKKDIARILTIKRELELDEQRKKNGVRIDGGE